MSGDLGFIPPEDPEQDAARRVEVRRRGAEWWLFVGLIFAQIGLAALLGAWAASGWVDPAGKLAGRSALGLVLALIGAHVVGYGAMLLLGSVALLSRLPMLFRRRNPAPVHPPGPVHASASARLLFATLVAIHGGVLLAGSLLVCTALALTSESADAGAWWRYALLPLLLTPVTARMLRAWWHSESG